MDATLTLDAFVDLSACLHGHRCRERNAFHYLGKPLQAWLGALLDDLGVGDVPVVRGKVAAGAILEGRVFIDEGAC